MKIKWTDMDLQTAFEDGCKFKDLEDLKDFLKKRKQLSERQTPTNDKKEADSKALNIAVVMPRFFFWRFIFTYPDQSKGYTVIKAETKDNAIADFNKIFPELKYYRIDFLNEA